MLIIQGSIWIYDELVNSLPEGSEKDRWTLLLLAIDLFTCCVWLVRVLYYLVERATYQYGTSGGNLYLRRGLIRREAGSFPLSRITDIYLHRGWGDFFWGLSTLHISTPTTKSGEFAYIHGLSIADAEALRGRLEGLVKQGDQHLESIGSRVGLLLALEQRRTRNRRVQFGGNDVVA